MANTFADLFTELKTMAVTELADLTARAISLEHQIIPIIEADLVAILSQFKQLAITTILNFAQAEFAAMSGHEKQSTVVTTVFQAAEAAGKQVALQDVTMFVQQAYNAVASSLAASAAPAGP